MEHDETRFKIPIAVKIDNEDNVFLWNNRKNVGLNVGI